ncbi:hypothetical protein GCM10020255_030310 [Rhodococcus baikonurensis]
MSEEMKPVLERQMEVYAGFLEHTDFHVGRLVDAIEELGALDNTLVYYIIGDNGASAEGTINGAFNEMANFNGLAAIETPEFMAEVKDKFGTKDAYNHYSVGWAWAMCTPYQWTKQVASHWGGTRNGTIVHWRQGFGPRGDAVAVRPRHRRCTDDPRGCETAGTDLCQRRPAITHRGDQHGLHLRRRRSPRTSRSAVLRDGGNRGIYYKGWSAVTRHSTPWLFAEVLPLSTTTCGNSTTGHRIGRNPMIWPLRCRRNWLHCNACG